MGGIFWKEWCEIHWVVTQFLKDGNCVLFLWASYATGLRLKDPVSNPLLCTPRSIILSSRLPEIGVFSLYIEWRNGRFCGFFLSWDLH